MGWQATGWAFKSPIENPGCKFVLVALAERAGNEDDGRSWHCFPSIETIQEYTSQGYRTIQRHLEWLESNGFIARERRITEKARKGSYNFTLNPQRCQNGQWPEKAPEPAQNGQTEPVKGTSQDIVGLSAREPFEEWWAIYPRKVAKVAARKAWSQMTGQINAITLAELMTRTRAFADHVVDLEEQHIPHAATWLRGERWNDERQPTRSQTDGQRPTGADRAIDRSNARLDAMVEGARIAAASGRRRWTVDGS
jgi:hypothetical protein